MRTRWRGWEVIAGVVLLHVTMIASFDALGRYAHGNGALAVLVRETNIPFLLGWACIAAITIQRVHLPPPWLSRRDDVGAPSRLAFGCAAALVLVFLYADAGCRLVHYPFPVHAPTRIVEVVVLAPLVEELLFRSLLWEACRRWTRRLAPNSSLFVTLAVTALAFALWHVRPEGARNLVGHALFGVAVGCLRLATGRLAPCIAVHAVGNALTLVYETP